VRLVAQAVADVAGLRTVEFTPEDVALLAFEMSWWTTPGAKVERIRSELGMPPSRYYKRLGELIDSPEALAHDPLLIRRLRRRRGYDDEFGTPASGRPHR